MADSIRQQVINALDTRLKTITIANGYLTDLGTNVAAWSTTPFDPQNETFKLEYLDQDVTTSAGGDIPVGVHSHKMKVTLRLIVKDNTPIDLVRKYNADIMKAIGVEAKANGSRWSGLAIRTDPEGDRTQIDRAANRFGGQEISFYITFRTLEWDPYSAV